MSLFVGAKLSCDREGCGWSTSAATEAELRERAASEGWSSLEGIRDYCPHCTKLRAERPKLADLLPGYTLMKILDAARAAGFTVEGEGDDTKVTCCGSPVHVDAMIGCPYFAKCETCEAAIVDAAGPSFGKSTVAFMDSDKVDADSGETWYVVGTEPAAQQATP